MPESGDVCIDSTDIGMSFSSVGRTAKNSRKQLDGGVLISLVMMLLEKSIVKRPFQRRWGMN